MDPLGSLGSGPSESAENDLAFQVEPAGPTIQEGLLGRSNSGACQRLLVGGLLNRPHSGAQAPVQKLIWNIGLMTLW